MTTEIRWLWLKYKLCRVKSFRVIVSVIKDHGQYIHIYPRGKFVPGEQAQVVNPVSIIITVDGLILYLSRTCNNV